MRSLTSSQLAERIKELARTLPPREKLRLLARLQRENWLDVARTDAKHPCGCGLSHSQVEPSGDWRVWFLQGGRGAGKTRTGAETLAGWIRDYCLEPNLGDWAIIAPTIADARDTCMEGPSGLLRALHGLVDPSAWNRSHGELFLPNGSRVYCGEANSGAHRINGKNLRGAWCDEVGLWESWDQAWNYSLQPAVRLSPDRIVATGTPKMGHPLIANLIESSQCVVHHMRTVDNEENLSASAIASLLEAFPPESTIGRQELEGFFIEALEGSLLSRHDWQFFDVGWEVAGRIGRIPDGAGKVLASRFGKFERIVHSWDTTWKAKSTSDFVAGQCWGLVDGGRYLLGIFHERATLERTIEAMLEMRDWSEREWPDVRQDVVIENATWGPEAAAAVRRRVLDVHTSHSRGDKANRAFTASPALETHQCYLPGAKDEDPSGRGYTSDTPAKVQAFVEECAHFRADMKHAHDDQVDAWSQMVNWTRAHRKHAPVRFGRPSGHLGQPGSLARV